MVRTPPKLVSGVIRPVHSVLFAIVGHDSTLQTDEYGEDVVLHILKGQMDLLDYDVDLSHLNYVEFKSYQDEKGKERPD